MSFLSRQRSTEICPQWSTDYDSLENHNFIGFFGQSVCQMWANVRPTEAQHLSDVGKWGACKAELPAIGEPIEVNEEQFNEIIRESKVSVLTDFWAPWCGPCRTAAPHVAQTAQDLAGRAVVLKVDTERFPGLAAQYNVRSIPNFAVFSRGQLQFQQAGLVDAATMESWLTHAA